MWSINRIGPAVVLVFYQLSHPVENIVESKLLLWATGKSGIGCALRMQMTAKQHRFFNGSKTLPRPASGAALLQAGILFTILHIPHWCSTHWVTYPSDPDRAMAVGVSSATRSLSTNWRRLVLAVAVTPRQRSAAAVCGHAS